MAQGYEAGGHRGTFLGPAEDGLIGTFALVPQVGDDGDTDSGMSGIIVIL